MSHEALDPGLRAVLGEAHPLVQQADACACMAPAMSVGAIESPAEAKAALNETDALLTPLDEDMNRAMFHDKILPPDFYASWKTLYGNWLAYKGFWEQNGISPVDAVFSDISARTDQFRTDARAFQAKFKEITGKDTTTPTLPPPTPKPPGVTEAVSQTAKAVAAVAVVVGVIYVLRTFK